MLIGMTERGPDSAGIAVYHSPVKARPARSPYSMPTSPIRGVSSASRAAINVEVDIAQKGNHALLIADCAEPKVTPG